MPLLLDALTNAMTGYLEGRCAFFGHSLGAVIAFEFAHRLLAERGLRLDHLFVSGRRAPQVPDRDPPTYDLPDAEFIAEMRRLDGTPPEVLDHPEVLALLLPVIRSDFELAQAHAFIARPPLPCRITALGGLTDQDVTRQDLEAWQEQTAAPLQVRMLPGGHFFLQTREQQVLDIIEMTLLRDDVAHNDVLAK